MLLSTESTLSNHIQTNNNAEDMQIESKEEPKEYKQQDAEGRSEPMEGVFEYPKSHTMTAEELARHRRPKRTVRPSAASDQTHSTNTKKSTVKALPVSLLQAAIPDSAPFASAVPSQSTVLAPVASTPSFDPSTLSSDAKPSATNQVKIEQDDEILMEGMHEVWHGAQDTKKNDDDSTVVSLYSATALPTIFTEQEDDDDSL